MAWCCAECEENSSDKTAYITSIMNTGKTITWDDIAGLEYIKKIIKENVVFPMLRPDIFTGLLRPPKGILLFGPPGTGKTLIGKCIASQSKSTFFSISASFLTGIGDGEKMVRTLFAMAKVHQPSVVFIGEIDSLRTEDESSWRIKTEFLVQLDGAEDDRILIVGATNRPQELDEAVRRRLVKRLYVPLPELEARKQIINNLLGSDNLLHHNLDGEDVARIAEESAGYSGADMTNLWKEAIMEPIRSIPDSQLQVIRREEVRDITSCDFDKALINTRPGTILFQMDLNIYIEWNRTYGFNTTQGYKNNDSHSKTTADTKSAINASHPKTPVDSKKEVCPIVNNRNESDNVKSTNPTTNPATEQPKSRKREVEKDRKVLTAWMPKVVHYPNSKSELGLTFEGKLFNEAGHVVQRKFTTDVILRRSSATLIETVNHEFYELRGHLNDNKSTLFPRNS